MSIWADAGPLDRAAIVVVVLLAVLILIGIASGACDAYVHRSARRRRRRRLNRVRRRADRWDWETFEATHPELDELNDH